MYEEPTVFVFNDINYKAVEIYWDSRVLVYEVVNGTLVKTLDAWHSSGK